MDEKKFDEITAEMNAEVETEEVTEEVTTGEDLLNLAETEDLTDEQKREIFIEQLKESKIHFRNVVHDGKVTTSKFGAGYRKTRQNKNKAQRKARKASH
jgi:hypothetical protein